MTVKKKGVLFSTAAVVGNPLYVLCLAIELPSLCGMCECA